VAGRLLDKLLQREALRTGGVASPLYWEVPVDRGPQAIEAFAREVRFPAVLKPRRSSGGRFTMPVEDERELVRQVEILPPEAGGAVGMFVEQYLPSRVAQPGDPFGAYVSVESVVTAGEITHVAVTGRLPLAEPFRETGLFIPADLPQAQMKAVLEVGTAALRAVGVRIGTCHTEIKLTPDGPRVIEVNGRLGGGIPEMFVQASGVSLVRLSMRIALGQQVDADGLVPCSKVGWCLMFQPPMTARRVVNIEGLDRLAELPGVNEVFVNRSPGDPVDWREGTRQYVFSVLGVSTDYDEMLEINRFLHEEVSVVYA
jgi:biotin carboxylase